MNRAVRTIAACPPLAFLVAAALARSLAARWRGTGARHARREIPPHPRPGIGGPGIGQPDVPLVLAPLPLPWPSTMPKRPAETVIDEHLLAAMWRPYIDPQQAVRAATGTRQGAA